MSARQHPSPKVTQVTGVQGLGSSGFGVLDSRFKDVIETVHSGYAARIFTTPPIAPKHVLEH